jgi:exosome complex component CSL4
MVVGNSPCKEDFQGIIRYLFTIFQRYTYIIFSYISYQIFSQQDVRATEKDKVKIYDSFRPGDIIRAEVVFMNILYFHYDGKL